MIFTGLQVIHKSCVGKLCSVPFFAGVLFFNSSLQNSLKGHAASLAVRESGSHCCFHVPFGQSIFWPLCGDKIAPFFSSKEKKSFSCT
jgi:hypothetical protein